MELMYNEYNNQTSEFYVFLYQVNFKNKQIQIIMDYGRFCLMLMFNIRENDEEQT